MLFSHRSGLVVVKPQDKNNLSPEMKVRIWNNFLCPFLKSIDQSPPESRHGFYQRLFDAFFRVENDRLTDRCFDIGGVSDVRRLLDPQDWYKWLDLCEFFCDFSYRTESYIPPVWIRISTLIGNLNTAFEEENYPWRLIDRQLVPVDTLEHQQALKQALKDTEGMNGVHKHLQDAFRALGARGETNYGGACNEAIMALEAYVRSITGTKSTLGQGLNTLRKDKRFSSIESALSSFFKLYGRISDAGGARHGSLDPQRCSFALAQFVVINVSSVISALSLCLKENSKVPEEVE